MCAAGLGAHERERGDQPRQRVGVAEQRLEPVGVAHGPGVAPDRLAGGVRRAAEAPLGGSGGAAGGSGSSSAARAARLPKTKHSLSEFEASRLAPWRPVQAHSPTASSPGSEVRPSRSVATPPIR